MALLPLSKHCYGCAACSNICSKQCIEMQINEYGELRPVVDIQLCINCGQCTKVCPALKQPVLVKPFNIYAMTTQSDKSRSGCASGGAAKLLYEQAIEKGAVVFGCDFDENNILRMKSAFTIEDIHAFRNSKYTFCRMKQCYNEIKRLLNQNIQVLFIGTSCQVYALKSFLGLNQNGLTTVDLICHGVPPEKYFYEYLEYKGSSFGKKIDEIKFRSDKKSEDFRLRLYSDGKCIYDVFAREEPFFAGYVNCAIFEERCYHCPFAKKERVSDISIGDWGGPTQLVADKLSLILVNTEKGKKCINKIMEQQGVLFESHTLQEAVRYNEQLSGTPLIPNQYFEMREYYKNNNFLMMSKKYIQPYIKDYRRKKRNEKMRYYISIPFRILRKLKGMGIKNQY